jgi:serine/threonine-protein kinase
MDLARGQLLGHYTLREPLGQGGMGVVWKADDARLGRAVALKLLPESLAQDPDRLARLEREARLLAALNHPHIATIHGLEEVGGTRFLVLELVPGETLASRIARGPLPPDEAREIARQVAEGLEAAHEAGVLHRDLKPANIQITPEGQAKILDFGLAKAADGSAAASDSSLSPTRTRMGTSSGVLLGTAPYMSPEQARGKALDRRADIWAFGCVLYECLTGRAPFRGETISDVLAKVIEREPDWALLPAPTPPDLQRLLRRCLDKDPRRRLRDIGEARVALSSTEPAPEPGAATPRLAAAFRALPWGLVVLLAAIALAAIAGRGHDARPTDRRPVRFRVVMDDPIEPIRSGTSGALAVAPDGSRFAVIVWHDEDTHIAVHDFARGSAALAAGTLRGYTPFFSEDAQWLGFVAEGQLKKVSLHGGLVVPIAPAGGLGADWDADSILFNPFYAEGLKRVAATGGEAVTVTTKDSSRNELGHFWPQILPGGKTALFTSFATPIDAAAVETVDLATGERKVVLRGAFCGRYAASGHLLALRGNTLTAAPFSLASLSTTGPPVPVLDDVAADFTAGLGHYAVSEEGTLVYLPRSALEVEGTVVWVDSTGRWEPVGIPPGTVGNVALSPDGRRIGLTLRSESRDVWTYDLARGSFSRLTHEPAAEFGPVWSADGRAIYYTTERPQFTLARIALDGTGAGEQLAAGEFDRQVQSVSSDGKWALITETAPETLDDIVAVALERPDETFVFRRTAFDEDEAAFSPDGHWVAYRSNDSGQSQVFVQPFRSAGERVQISNGGGWDPCWSRDGLTLYFKSDAGLMAVPVTSDWSAPPHRLFEVSEYPGAFDVAADGRFLMVRVPKPTWPRTVNVVLHWFEELQRLAPTGN